MPKQPLVSIIIPTFNRAHLIGETLDSVLAQTYQNWECIVVDDGSTDHTADVMQMYCSKDSRFQYHHRPKDRLQGGNGARNYGFEISNGEYINWFDSDDVMCDEKLQIQIGSLESSSYNFSVCQTLVFEGGIDNILGLRHDRIISKQPLLDFIKGEISFFTPSPLFKKPFLRDFNLKFDEELKAAQEWGFLTKVLFYSPVYIALDTPLIKIRKHNSSISFNGNYDLRKWYYYLAREKLFLFLKDKKTSNKKEINTYLFSYFQSRITSYMFERKEKESWIIFNNILKDYYSFPKSVYIKLYIKFVLLTGRGYNFRNKIIS